MMDISVIIPALPGRRFQCRDRALSSVAAQTLRPRHVFSALDEDGRGAAAMRDELLASVPTDWVAPLDDDDEFRPDHLEGLATAIREHDADLAFAWYEIVGPTGEVEQWRDPHAQWEGVPWDSEHPHQVPTTFLARTELLRAVGGWSDYGRWHPGSASRDANGNRIGEDTLLIQRLTMIGARIVHHPARSYRWHHWGGNSSGWVGLNP